MGEVKTLRTGFLVFKTRIQVVSTALCKRAGSAVFLPAQGGSRGVHDRRFPRFALELHHTKWSSVGTRSSSRQERVSLVIAPHTRRGTQTHLGNVGLEGRSRQPPGTKVTGGPRKGDPSQ